MDWLSVVPWSGLGWGGLIFAAVLALIRGELVPRRLLPRPPREVGKRGQILLVFGLVWIGLGAGLLIEGDPAHYDQIVPFTWLSADVRTWLWIATGAAAVAYAWRPRIIAHDGIIGVSPGACTVTARTWNDCQAQMDVVVTT